MILARMRLDDTDGKKALVGRTLIDVPKGCLMTLLKDKDGRWELFAIGGDGRRIDTSEQSLFSFILPAESENKVVDR